MNPVQRIAFVVCLIVLLLFANGIIASGIKAAQVKNIDTNTEWAILWGDPSGSAQEQPPSSEAANWMTVPVMAPMPMKPDGVTSAWIKIQLPASVGDHSGILIGELYAQHLTVYVDGNKVQESIHDFPYDLQRILVPLSHEDAGKTVYLKMETGMDRMGIRSNIEIGSYSDLLPHFVVRDLGDVILGCALIFIAAVMFICAIFLKKIQLPSWISLGIVILTMGTIFVTYSPFMYAIFGEYGAVLVDFFDLSLVVFLPALSYFFEKIFDDGNLKLIKMFRKFQIGYSAFSALCMVINQLSGYRFADEYFFISVTLLGCIMLVQLSLLITFSVKYAMRGNKDAVIFTSGFAFFGLLGVIDLIWFYASNQTHQIFLWKWGIVGFVISLITLLGRRFAAYQELMANYSKELEFYNNQLQLSEKMEIISSLAASVAHEVRNPLQVTRGFLQLLSHKSDMKQKEYMSLAIEELDRASGIITDFLTFAKPQLEEVTVLNVSKELKQIEGIIVPLATLHGGGVFLSIPQELYIHGNSSKLKQALINIIKNSIEAFRDQGQINIWAYEESEEVVIHIKDNGEGIEPATLAKLGEPYFSTKTKGTGLGLMVTFRIIEVMKGRLEFKSEKNKGTEAIIRFPSVIN